MENNTAEKSKNYVEVSRVARRGDRIFVEKDGRPYTMHALHIRPDLIYQRYKLKTAEDFDSVLKPYYREAARLGFKTVNCQIHWREIEKEKDCYDFSFWDRIYSYLEEYDLNIQLLWCGSDNCGWYSDNIPAYVRENTTEYYLMPYICPDGVERSVVLDYSNPKLLEREKKVIEKLMEHLYEFDIHHRTVAFQVMNEANANGAGLRCPVPRQDSPAEEVDRVTWVGGQEKALMHMMNELGLAVKNGPYRCITRVNFISYHCYNNGVSDAPKRVAALPGIDIVGMDCFDTGKTMDKYFMTEVADYPTNVPHIPEAPAGVYSIFAKMLEAFKIGGSLFVYELRSSADDDSLSVMRLSDGDFVYRDGTKPLKNSILEASTYDWISFNAMVNAIGEMLLITPLCDIAVFNTVSQVPRIEETRRVGDIEVTFRSASENMYGSVGLSMRAADGSYLFYSLNSETAYIIKNATVSGSASVGYYDGEDWVETGVQAAFKNGFYILPDRAAKGKLFRIRPEQLCREEK